MSLEIQAGRQCPHLIVEEPVVLGEDRLSLQTRAAISGAGSVQILANDQHIPPGGLYSQAVLVADRSGPYSIQQCTLSGPGSNLLTITTNAGSAQIQLPVGSRIPLADVQRAIRLSAAATLVRVSERNGALTLIESSEVGGESFIRISGLAAGVLGFSQLGARGAQLFPSWGLVARQDIFPAATIAGVNYVTARFPQFTSKVKGSPTFKVTYAAMPERCPRCCATSTENDYRFDYFGDIVLIDNESLLQQACLKAILTVQGSNPYHLKYGSKIMTRIGQKATGMSSSLIKEDVMNALKQVQSLQARQRKSQTVSDKEFLYTVQSVNVRTSTVDQTVYFVDVVVRNGSNQPISIPIVYTVPGATALAGTNGLSLGLGASELDTSASRVLLDR